MKVGRLTIEAKNPEIARQINFLISHNYNDHEVADYISSMIGHRISHKLVGRYRRRHPQNKVPSKTLSFRPILLGPLGRVCIECKKPTLIDDQERGEIVCSSCGLVNYKRKVGLGKGIQVDQYAPERPLSESHGLGSWTSYSDLLKLGLRHVSWAAYASVKGTGSSRKEVRAMRRYASRVLEELPCFSSKTNELMKARKAQISKAAAELIDLTHERLLAEVENSAVLTESILKVNWKAYVPSILNGILSSFLPENHSALKQFQKKYPTDEALQKKIERLLLDELQQSLSPRSRGALETTAA